MSHFSIVKTIIKDQEILEETLRRLQYRFRCGKSLPIEGYNQDQSFGQIVVDTGCAYDIGFQQTDDQSFDICADWWGVESNSNLRQVTFLHEVSRNYAHIAIKKQIEEQGYIVELERVHENGEIELVVCEAI